MDWKPLLGALVIVPVLAAQAAAQANATKPATPAAPAQAAMPAKPVVQPAIESRKAPVITVSGLKFRDLNKNGVLDRYEDWRLPVAQRVADLVSRMTPEEFVM